ncbi:MAG: hypothetical protein EXR75_15420 [Myxococcales bacterium]|nr:hypothetical protein [Myxococcales bacterium]
MLRIPRLGHLGRALVVMGVATASIDARAASLHFAAAPSTVPFAAGPGSVAPKPINDFAKRSGAGILGADGLKLYRSKSYAEALEKFELANRLMRAPTLELHIARCHEKLGRLVEASETYLEASRFPLDRTSTQAFIQAVKSAELERVLIEPRIPKLRVLVSGPAGTNITVLLDNRVLPPELLDSLMPVNPGAHEVLVRRADLTVVEKTQIAEGQTARIQVRLPPLSEGVDPGPEVRASRERERMHTFAIASYAAGAGGLIAAGISGGFALSKAATLEDACPNRTCGAGVADGDLAAYDAARYATTAGLVLGGIGLAAGSVFLLLAPAAPAAKSEKVAASLQLSAWLRAGQVGVAGRF